VWIKQNSNERVAERSIRLSPMAFNRLRRSTVRIEQCHVHFPLRQQRAISLRFTSVPPGDGAQMTSFWISLVSSKIRTPAHADRALDRASVHKTGAADYLQRLVDHLRAASEQ